MAQTGWQEKERTRTDAERIVGLHIKPLHFLWRCVVTDTSCLNGAWRGHAVVMDYKSSSEQGSILMNMRPLKRMRPIARWAKSGPEMRARIQRMQKGMGCSWCVGRREEVSANEVQQSR